jgi:hypothetical protein
MSYGQTNGIPQGSVLMDFIAELVLGYIDKELAEKIDCYDYKIIRYRDDYRIFSNSKTDIETILKKLSILLIDYGMKLNSEKTTKISDNIIQKSIKPDKLFWVRYKQKFKCDYKSFLNLYLLSIDFPNSGTLIVQIIGLHKKLETLISNNGKKKQKEKTKIKKDSEEMISIITNIILRNPLVYMHGFAIIQDLIWNYIEPIKKDEIIRKVIDKLTSIPNNTLMDVWLHRLSFNSDDKGKLDKSNNKLIKATKNQKLYHGMWNIDWLEENKQISDLIKYTTIIDNEKYENAQINPTANHEISYYNPSS